VGGQAVVPRQLLLALLRRGGFLGFPEGVVIDDWEVLDIEVHGDRGGQPVLRHAQARFPPRPEWRLSATEYAVGVCGAIGAEFLVDGTVRGAGVVPPERCVPAGPFRAALGRRGIETAITPEEPPLGPEYRKSRAK
jgi:saccharopine dehydrogenase-like NADP-dependent oxidoreductase